MEKFEALQATEKQYFLDMVKQCKDSGANLIICQWCVHSGSSPSRTTAISHGRPRQPHHAPPTSCYHA